MKLNFAAKLHFFLHMSKFFCNFAAQNGAKMKLLLVLLTVMTFTIEKKNEVSMAGLWPYDIVVDYANTGTKGNVGAGDKATLSLSGLENIQIESVTL